MLGALTLVSLLVLQDGVELKYKVEQGEEQTVQMKNTFALEWDGDEDSIDFIRGLSPFFAFESIEMEGPMVIEALKTRRKSSFRMRKRFDTAKVTGVYDEEDYEFEFDREDYQPDPDDPLEVMLHAFFNAGTSYRLSPDGKAREIGGDKDPNSEALALFGNPHPRFPEEPVEVGETWEMEWKTVNTDNDTGGKLILKQTATLEKLDGDLATIKVKYEGKDDRDGEDDNGNINEVKVEGTVTVVFNVEEGRIVSHESEGFVESHAEGEDPNGTYEYDFTLTMKASSKMTPEGDEDEDEEEDEGDEDDEDEDDYDEYASDP